MVQTQQVDDLACWEEGRHIASLLTLTPNAFTTCIRFLRKDARENKGAPSAVTKYCLGVLLRNATVKSAIYHAALTYKPEMLAMYSVLDKQAFFEIFSASEYASLLGMLLLYRRVQKGCPPESFKPMADVLNSFTDIGGHLGIAIPEIGFANGVIIGAIRHLAAAMFLGIDEKNFKKMRRSLKIEDRLFDPDTEIKLWKSSYIHIASNMIQLLGLGVDLASSLAQGLFPTIKEETEMSKEVFRVRITVEWLESLYKTGAPPNIVHKGEYYPRAQALKVLTERVDEVRAGGSKYSWLSKTKADISPDTTPMLFPKTLTNSLEENPRKTLTDEIPSELLRELAQSQIDSVESEDPE